MTDQNKTKGKLIVFASAKGGVGKTIISTNCAVALANKGFSTCILDGSFEFGDINLALDIKTNLTIIDLIKDIKSLNSDFIEHYILNHESGVKTLSAPLKPEYADLITPDKIQCICKKLLEVIDFLIVDLSTGFSENNIAFMELANKLFIVSTLEMAALKNTKLMLKTLESLNMSEKSTVIINRGNIESLIKFKDVKKTLEIDDLIYISNNFKLVSKSFNIGIPFTISKPNEKISNEIFNLAKEIYKDSYIPRKKRKQKRSWFSFFK